MRCKCGEPLTTYDMTVKRRIQLETGQIIEVHEDLCNKCRRSWDEIVFDIEDKDEEEELS